MAKIYDVADEALHKLAHQVMKRFHQPVAEYFKSQEEKAPILVMLVTSTSDSPALMHGGAPAAATIRIASPKDQAMRWHRLLIQIDNLIWTEVLQAEQRTALLDHELTHVEVRSTRSGPKLRLKPDDFQITGFFEVMARHGKFALETASVARVIKTAGEQGYLFDVGLAGVVGKVG